MSALDLIVVYGAKVLHHLNHLLKLQQSQPLGLVMANLSLVQDYVMYQNLLADFVISHRL